MPTASQPWPRGGSRLNAALALACLCLAVVLPALTLYGLLTTSAEAWLAGLGVRPAAGAAQTAWPIAPWQRGLATAVGMLPVGAVAYGLLRACLCLRGFGRGEGLSLHTVRHLRGLAAGMLAAAAAACLSVPLISVLLTMAAPAGRHMVTLQVGSNELLLLLFAGIVWQIAHVMTQAVELAEDHAQII